MIYQITQFAGTCQQQPNGAVMVTNTANFVLLDQNSSVLQPNESYLITISKIASPQIIIEETQIEKEETTQTVQEMA